jgi:predicted transcriptional regulator
MYAANLSFTQMRYYLRLLQERQMIEIMGGKWLTSARGRDFLKVYDDLQKIIESGNEQEKVFTSEEKRNGAY